jgi:hypothetical protein
MAFVILNALEIEFYIFASKKIKTNANSDWFITYAIKSYKTTSTSKQPQDNKKSGDHKIPTPTIDLEPKKKPRFNRGLNVYLTVVTFSA